MPDLERIVSRIHAKNCKVREFLKVLGVCFACSQMIRIHVSLQCFKKLNKGLEDLIELAETLSSSSIRELLRTAPDLSSHIANVESTFEQPEGGMPFCFINHRHPHLSP